MPRTCNILKAQVMELFKFSKVPFWLTNKIVVLLLVSQTK